MPRPFDRLDPQPSGFGKCGSCAYRRSGSAGICHTCASRHTEPNPPVRCPLCGQAIEQRGARCLNRICRRNLAHRWYGHVRAIAPDSGPMRQVIRSYKYEEQRAWGQILGRVLLGHLDEHAPEFDDYDIIIPMPAYVGPGARRSWDHIDLVVQHASTEDSYSWPFRREPAVIVRTDETERMSGKNWENRERIATEQLRTALRVRDGTAVSGQQILVIDDVFTTGHNMVEVARALRLAGAAAVDGLVLARAQWRQRL